MALKSSELHTLTSKVKYKCAKCGWETEIGAAWADLRPKRCLGKVHSAKACGTSFLREPQALLVEVPAPPAVEATPAPRARKERRITESDEV